MEDSYLFRYDLFGGIPVTLQVGLIGKDGFVIASDRKATVGGEPTKPLSTEYNKDRSADVCKLFIPDTKSLVCAASGNEVALQLARALRRRIEKLVDVRGGWEDAVRDIFEGFSEPVRNGAQGNLFVALPNERIFHSVRFVPGDILFSELNRVIGGHFANSAIYFPETFHSADKSVDELTVLAAHTVLEGAKRNPSGIGGLDVVVSQDNSLRFLDAEELEVVRQKSHAIHQTLEKAFFN